MQSNQAKQVSTSTLLNYLAQKYFQRLEVCFCLQACSYFKTSDRSRSVAVVFAFQVQLISSPNLFHQLSLKFKLVSLCTHRCSDEETVSVSQLLCGNCWVALMGGL